MTSTHTTRTITLSSWWAFQPGDVIESVSDTGPVVVRRAVPRRDLPLAPGSKIRHANSTSTYIRVGPDAWVPENPIVRAGSVVAWKNDDFRNVDWVDAF